MSHLIDADHSADTVPAQVTPSVPERGGRRLERILEGSDLNLRLPYWGGGGGAGQTKIGVRDINELQNCSAASRHFLI